MPRVVSLWLPVVAWAAVIFALSSIPGLGTGFGVWDLILRKLAHAVSYAILGFLLVRATRSPAAAVLLGVAYGVTDEIHQHFVADRHGTPVDVAIDAVGVVIGVYAAGRLSTIWNRGSAEGDGRPAAGRAAPAPGPAHGGAQGPQPPPRQR